MAKSAIMVVAALCLMSFVGSAYGLDKFFVEGKVYCDTCRIQFLTRVSDFLPDSIVRLECKKLEGGNVTYSKEAKTDASGSYKIEVDGDHEEEMCEVVLVKSGREDCAEIDRESHLEQAARVSVTNKNGIISPIRSANPLGFLKKHRLPICSQVFRELGLLLLPDGSLDLFN